MPRNAVLDDAALVGRLKELNPKFGDFCARVAGEAWGLPLLDQKTTAFITIVIAFFLYQQIQDDLKVLLAVIRASDPSVTVSTSVDSM